MALHHWTSLSSNVNDFLYCSFAYYHRHGFDCSLRRDDSTLHVRKIPHHIQTIDLFLCSFLCIRMDRILPALKSSDTSCRNSTVNVIVCSSKLSLQTQGIRFWCDLIHDNLLDMTYPYHNQCRNIEDQYQMDNNNFWFCNWDSLELDKKFWQILHHTCFFTNWPSRFWVRVSKLLGQTG